MERFKSVLSSQEIVESTVDETHLSIKLSKKNFRGILEYWNTEAKRTLVVGLTYGRRANK